MTVPITYRSVKGSRLTHAEVDANWLALANAAESDDFINEFSASETLQPHMGKQRVYKWISNNGSPTHSVLGSTVLTLTGTATAYNASTTSRATRFCRTEALVTTPATTNVAGFRYTTHFGRIGDPSESDMGGFRFYGQWCTATGMANVAHRAFFGIGNSISAPTDVNPSTITNIVGMGWDSADANVQIMHRGAGAITKIDLGASFLKPSVDRDNVYRLDLSSPPGTTQSVSYRVTNLVNMTVASGTITTNLPSASSGVTVQAWASVGGVSDVIGFGFSQVQIETGY